MNIIDLFCGCGGMTLGFSKAGYNIVAGLDNWDKAIETYRQNFTHPVIQADLKDTSSAIELIADYRPDMIIGGPPCQDFSSAGKRDENNGRGDLTISYATIVASISPEWFVMENVARIVKTQKLKEAKQILRSAGYGMTQCVLDASLCGVPQARKRFFLIGKKNAADGFLLPFIEKNLADKPMTVADYFGNNIEVTHYYRHPRSYARRGIFSIHEPSPTIRGVNRPMPQGYQLHPGDPVTSLDGIRELTTEERSRIQTFPDTFILLGNKTEKEQMVGNAVPVNLAYFIGKSIWEYILHQKRVNSILSQDDMEYWKRKSSQMTLFNAKSPYLHNGIAVCRCPKEHIRWITENMRFCLPNELNEISIGEIKGFILIDDNNATIGCYSVGEWRSADKKYLMDIKHPLAEETGTTVCRLVELKPFTENFQTTKTI